MLSVFAFFQTLAYFFMLTPEPSLYTTLTRGGATKNYAVYDIPGALQNNSFFNPAAKYNIQHQQKPIKPPLLHTHRFQTGKTRTRSCIIIINPSLPLAPKTVWLFFFQKQFSEKILKREILITIQFTAQMFCEFMILPKLFQTLCWRWILLWPRFDLMVDYFIFNDGVTPKLPLNWG